MPATGWEAACHDERRSYVRQHARRDPHLKQVLNDHIDFPQGTVLREDTLSVLNHAPGKISPTTMTHVAMAMGYLPREVELQQTTAPAEHRARIIHAAERADIPQHLIQTIQQEL